MWVHGPPWTWWATAWATWWTRPSSQSATPPGPISRGSPRRGPPSSARLPKLTSSPSSGSCHQSGGTSRPSSGDIWLHKTHTRNNFINKINAKDLNIWLEHLCNCWCKDTISLSFLSKWLCKLAYKLKSVMFIKFSFSVPFHFASIHLISSTYNTKVPPCGCESSWSNLLNLII